MLVSQSVSETIAASRRVLLKFDELLTLELPFLPPIVLFAAFSAAFGHSVSKTWRIRRIIGPLGIVFWGRRFEPISR